MSHIPLNTRHREKIAGALFLVTGAALVVHILIGLPLWLTVSGGVLLAVAGFVLLGDSVFGRRLRPKILAGLVAGAVATVCYDISRILLISLTGSTIEPFEAWQLFGVSLVGTGASAELQWVAGTAFHLTNGLAFGVAFTIWLGDRGLLWGIGFALGLEIFMLGLYPGWLNIRAFGEFTQVSVMGHVVYGSVLGVLARQSRGWLAAAENTEAVT